MGVTGLWTILHPCARPIKLETLNRKRLAVDASIWIYQFLKAVRDKEGNALRNSHVVGFFRRICKLLFFGIKPVFVFDGGAPVLKRQTVSERKKRREGRREDAVRTAGKLLAVQMQRRAEEEDQRRREENAGPAEEEEALPEDLVYADENMMSAQERQQQTRKFKKKDQYHLPELDVSMNELGGANDPRVMSLEELQAYAKQFETGEDINVYDFSKIDYDSPFFTSLPASDRYNILNAARLRSRLRMGHSKEQLDSMFPDRMAFSKFQIERVRERNELTQRLMHVNEGGDTAWDGGRIAGEKGREYVLVKNDGVEGGWALGVIGGDEGTKEETAIDLDKPAPAVKEEDEDWEDDDGFEDVPIEGLNRLPKRQKLSHENGDAYAKQRRAFYKSRRSAVKPTAKPAADPDSLFVQDEPADVEGGDDWEEVNADGELFGNGQEDEDEELNRAIAMSLQKDEPDERQPEVQPAEDEADDDMLEVFQQSAVEDARPVPKGSARAIANIMNKRAKDTAPESREVTSFGVPALREESDEEDSMDLQAALADSRRTKRKVSSPQRRQPAKPNQADGASDVAKAAGFSGPLPFEKLDLGSSLLGKKKMKERTEETAGGFENPALAEQQKKAEPLPPWFSGDLESDIQKQRDLEDEDRQRTKEFNRQFQFQSRDEPTLRRKDTNEVIDLDAEDESPPAAKDQIIDLEADEAGRDDADETIGLDDEVRMGDVADKVHVEPPITTDAERRKLSSQAPSSKAQPFEMAESESDEGEAEVTQKKPIVDDHHGRPMQPSRAKDPERSKSPAAQPAAAELWEASPDQADEEDEEDLPWSESENEDSAPKKLASNAPSPLSPARQPSRSPSADFEDVQIPDRPASPPARTNSGPEDNVAAPASGTADQQFLPDDDIEHVEFDDFSDPEDEELLHQLTAEAEEHARFASTLNNKTQAQNIAEYEKELKQLRNQQKKDRRDADEVTHIMVQECQQLLRLFGLPYVTAPMEAEAQCAELVSLGLVDGIVTDDSDCFLFGGTRIYKNMFNQAKFVECYLASDLEKEFDLTRNKMVSIAHLLGSDYTEGLPGIGPVTALEILGEFPNLEDFKTWWSGIQMNSIPKSQDKGNAFRKKFRKNASKLFLPQNFPDPRVSAAYHQPEVDTDPSAFEWGVPDLDALRSFLMATIGWSQERTDEVLVPVIRDMNRRADEGTQANITAFFEGGVGIGAAGATKASASRGEAFAPRKRVQESSKRMGSALSRMAERAKQGRGESVPEVIGEGEGQTADEPAAAEKPAKKGKRAAKQAPPASDSGDDSAGSEFEAPTKKKKQRKAPVKRKRGKAAG